MKLLIDSHALLWRLTDHPRLSGPADAAISDPENEAYVSAAVGYELAYKQRLGRLPQLPEGLTRRLRRDGVDIMPITLDHALAAAALRGPHRDPWDRIMMAQALAEGCQVVTIDPVFLDYGVPVIW